MTAFEKYYVEVFKEKYANFSGRASRKEYWYFTLFQLISIYTPILLLVAIEEFYQSDFLESVFTAIYLVTVLITLLPSLAVSVRRFHDTGNSGWLLLILLVPCIGSLLFFIITLTDSQEFTNKWGPNPKAPPNRIEEFGEHLSNKNKREKDGFGSYKKTY